MCCWADSRLRLRERGRAGHLRSSALTIDVDDCSCAEDTNHEVWDRGSDQLAGLRVCALRMCQRRLKLHTFGG